MIGFRSARRLLFLPLSVAVACAGEPTAAPQLSEPAPTVMPTSTTSTTTTTTSTTIDDVPTTAATRRADDLVLPLTGGLTPTEMVRGNGGLSVLLEAMTTLTVWDSPRGVDWGPRRDVTIDGLPAPAFQFHQLSYVGDEQVATARRGGQAIRVRSDDGLNWLVDPAFPEISIDGVLLQPVANDATRTVAMSLDLDSQTYRLHTATHSGLHVSDALLEPATWPLLGEDHVVWHTEADGNPRLVIVDDGEQRDLPYSPDMVPRYRGLAPETWPNVAQLVWDRTGRLADSRVVVAVANGFWAVDTNEGVWRLLATLPIDHGADLDWRAHVSDDGQLLLVVDDGVLYWQRLGSGQWLSRELETVFEDSALSRWPMRVLYADQTTAYLAHESEGLVRVDLLTRS